MDERKHLIYLSLGSNLGERQKTIEKALSILEEKLGNIVMKSSYYATEAWGVSSLDEFYNLVAAFETTLDALEVLDITQSVEVALGRLNKTVHKVYLNRSIDIDILFFDKQVILRKNLIIPHPLLHQRKFVLMPLNEISPSLIHPQFNQSISELLSSLKDRLNCKKLLN